MKKYKTMSCFINMVVGLLVASVLGGCYHKSDKQNSDIASIIPLPDDDKGSYAIEARYSNWPDPDTMLIYVDGSRFKVSSDGIVFSPEGKMAFSICCDGRVEQLFFLQRGRDFFVFFSDVNDSGTATFAKRISLNDGNIVWSTELEGISITRPLVRSQFAYVGTFGFIGKIKLKTGQFDWKYNNLRRNGRFEKFRDIDFPDSRQVRFVAPHPYSMENDTIIINDITGEILRMN